MQLELIGPHPFARDAQGQQMIRIGTLFPEQGVLYTCLPGLHAMQRAGFTERLNTRRAERGQPAMTLAEEQTLCANSVDLIFEPDNILIRPDPERMDLACAADEQLQSLVSKRQVKFLSVSDSRVREALKHRGESWRLSSIPKTQEAKERAIFASKVAIHGLPIYFYNQLTGTRWLTCQEFEDLGKLDDVGLAQHLQDIADHTRHPNRIGQPEIDFFAADLRPFGAHEFAGVQFPLLPSDQLRAKHVQLVEHFRSAVHDGFRRDDYKNKAWARRMVCTLFLDGCETQTEQVLSLSSEFFLQVEWLPGGRFEEGEFLFDSIFDEAASQPEDPALQRLCDPRAKGIIFNLIREHGDLEYINVGCVSESLSLNRPLKQGRRGVYLAEFQLRGAPRPLKRFMRLQKWGVAEHLDEGKELLQSIEESDDYTDYSLDRCLGCRQLGMNLPNRVVMRRLSEVYQGTNPRFRNQVIRTTYFEREYLEGMATDKLPGEKYSQTTYAVKFAELLGRAAASSLIVGRSLGLGTRPVFDDGDEVVHEGLDGIPCEILVGDHTGAFGEYKLSLDHFAAHYARPVNTRDAMVPNPKAFAEAYLAGFLEQFLHIQGDYRKRRRAFDTLFKQCKYDRGGSFAYRWECVLKRLDQTDAEQLIETIRKHIKVLQPGSQTARALQPAANGDDSPALATNRQPI